MDAEQLRQDYAAGKREFPWVDLQGANLTGMDLRGANFNRAKLPGASLRGAQLQGVNFTRADLTGADLTGADLTDCILRKAQLTGAIADLTPLPASALQGATLPDGAIAPLVIPIAPEPEPSPVETLSPPPLPRPAPGREPLPELLTEPLPVSGSARSRPLPYTPLSLWVGGYFVAGLTLYLAAGYPVAWAILALSASFWHWEDLTFFIPIVVGLAVLLGSPLTTQIGILVSTVLGLMAFGGLWVSGWPWRKALYGAVWVCGMAAVVLIWGSWLLFSPSYMAITLAPTFPLALLLVVALAGVTLGLTSMGALIDLGYGRSQRFRLLVGTAWGGLALAFCGGTLLALWLTRAA